jgi:hypothetical protein
MARYKLRVPQPGDFLYGDGDTGVVADTREEARQFLADDSGEFVPYLHSYIGSCRVVYKRDFDSCDCHDGAEPGDTTVDYCADDGRELRPHECRVWMSGPPPGLAAWSMKPIREPIDPAVIPVGTSAYHRRIGQGVTAGPGYVVGHWWYIPIEFRRWDGRVFAPWKTLNCKVACIGILPGLSWPKSKYRLEINGEHIADGSERALHTLVDIRVARLNAEWEAQQDRELQAATV